MPREDSNTWPTRLTVHNIAPAIASQLRIIGESEFFSFFLLSLSSKCFGTEVFRASEHHMGGI